jgi:murein L,D-transpeptidase YafK
VLVFIYIFLIHPLSYFQVTLIYYLAVACVIINMRSLLAVFFILTLFNSCLRSQAGLINYSLPLPDLLDSLPEVSMGIYLEIDKSDYVLSVMADSMVIKQYPVVFGRNPEDDKLRQGDGCTPEGRFRIRTKYPHRSWEKFIWIDYPTEESWRKHRQAKQDGMIEESASIGGEIGIHGVPRGSDRMIDLRTNWTLGCVSLKNRDINDFYPYVQAGTIVIIRK